MNRIILGLAAILATPAYSAENKMFWGWRSDQYSLIVSRSGLNTEHARIRVRIRENDKGTTPPLPTVYFANCKTGDFGNNTGDHFAWKSKDRVLFRQKRMDGTVSEENLVGPGASSQSMAIADQFKVLCPKRR